MSIHPLFRPISTSLSPNVQKDDVFLAAKLLFKTIYGFRNTNYENSPAKTLEGKFKEYLDAKYAFSFNSGRSALFTIIRALEMREGDEVLLQAFTCNAVPNPVLWADGKPVYVDIDESLNIDPDDLEKKITSRSRAIIIQHTLGVPAQIDKILEIARRHNLIIIEDCAHALGAKYNDRLVGTFGDIAFFSFGRDKVISAVWGGVMTTNNENLAKKIETLHQTTPYPAKSWTIKQLLHPILFSIIIPTYYIFGKYLLAFLRIARGVGLAVSQKERLGQKPDMFPARMPEALAALALHQFEKLEKYNEHRRKIAELYFRGLTSSLSFPRRRESRADSEKLDSRLPRGPRETGVGQGNDVSAMKLPPRKRGAIYLRFNILHPNAREVIQKAKKQHILLGDWYKNVIDPIGTDFEKMGYAPGSCPNAERMAKESINLPTHINISKKDAQSIVNFLKK